MKYPQFSREAAIHLLQTSPWLGNGYELVEGVPVSLIPAGGRRVGKCKLNPQKLVGGLLSGNISRSHLHGNFEIRQLPPEWDNIDVKAQKPGTGLYAKYDHLFLIEFAGEGRDSSLQPQSLSEVYQILTTGFDLLYPEGKAVEAGTATSIGGSGSDPGVVHDPTGDPQALVSTYIGNPWVGSDFVNAGPFSVDESLMYREETYKDGKVIRNGQVIVAGSYAGPPDSFTATADLKGVAYTGEFNRVDG